MAVRDGSELLQNRSLGMGTFCGFIVLQVHTAMNVCGGRIFSFIKMINQAKCFVTTP